MRRVILAGILGLIAAPAGAQTVANLPVTCNTAGTNCTQATPVTNPDGTLVGSGSGGTPTGTAGSPNAAVVSVQGVSGGTAQPVSATSLPLPTGASTSALQTTGNGSLSTISNSVGSVGSSAPLSAQMAGGKSADGNFRAVATDSGGRLLPGQGVVATARVTLSASTATQISATASGRIGLMVQVETALTANLFLCTTQTASCSATSYDAMIPTGSAAGSTYTFLFAPTTALYAFTTGTPTLVANSWIAN